jgi:hypothetical protein
VSDVSREHLGNGGGLSDELNRGPFPAVLLVDAGPDCIVVAPHHEDVPLFVAVHDE